MKSLGLPFFLVHVSRTGAEQGGTGREKGLDPRSVVDQLAQQETSTCCRWGSHGQRGKLFWEGCLGARLGAPA